MSGFDLWSVLSPYHRTLERKIGLIWTAIFMLAGLGTGVALASHQPAKWKLQQVGLILSALALNMCYTFAFTRLHNLRLATGIAVALGLLLLVLVTTVVYRTVWLSFLCHFPHLGWACLATYVTLLMAQLN